MSDFTARVLAAPTADEALREVADAEQDRDVYAYNARLHGAFRALWEDREARLQVAEQRGAERVFAALSVHFAAHPDFDSTLAEFDWKGWTKAGTANDEARIKELEERLEKADALAEALDLWHKSAASGSSKLMGDAAAVLTTSLAAYRDTEGETRCSEP